MLKKIINLCALFTALTLILLLNGCATSPTSAPDGPPKYDVDVSKIPNAKPQKLPKCAYGNKSVYKVRGKHYHVLNTARGYKQRGLASWYGTKFHGRLTSTRERYNMFAMTAASPVLPIPSFAKVTNLENGRSIIVKVNDRGPFASKRILDLSYVGAKKLGYAQKGTAHVQVEGITVDEEPFAQHTRLAAYQPPTQPPTWPHNPTLHASKLYLQVGAFHELQNAKSLKAKIETRMDKPVNIIKIASRQAVVYRVQVGPIKSQSEYEQLQYQLHRFSKLTTHRYYS